MAPQKVKTYYKVPRTKEQILAEHEERRDFNRAARERQTPVAEKIKNTVVGWGRRGMQNFMENASRPVARQDRPMQDVIRGKGRKAPRQQAGPIFDIPQEQGFNLDLGNLGGGLDMSMHPDPMYGGMHGGHRERESKEGKPKRVTVTTKTYHY